MGRGGRREKRERSSEGRMRTPVAVKEDRGIPFLQEENGKRVEDELGSRRRGERVSRVGLVAEGLEEGLGRALDTAEGLEDKRHKPAFVVSSELVVAGAFRQRSVFSRLTRSAVEVGGSSRMDDGDIDESEVVRKVKLKVRAITREAKVWGLQEAGNPKPVSRLREVDSDSVVTSSDRERPEELAGEEVSRVVSKLVATGAGGRKVVVGRKAEAQT